jgi:hypothetical protein
MWLKWLGLEICRKISSSETADRKSAVAMPVMRHSNAQG